MPGRKRADAMTARDEELAEMERLLDAIESRLKSQLSRGDGAIDEARAAQPRRRARASSADEEVGARAVRRGQVAGPAGGRRRVRRWGEAARKAARREIADGEHRSPRSLKAVREAFPAIAEGVGGADEAVAGDDCVAGGGEAAGASGDEASDRPSAGSGGRRDRVGVESSADGERISGWQRAVRQRMSFESPSIVLRMQLRTSEQTAECGWLNHSCHACFVLSMRWRH